MIKIQRYSITNDRYFHATDMSYESIWHGFDNLQNKWIGYWYQDQRKGFWFIERKY
jgi:hypothetical protein